MNSHAQNESFVFLFPGQGSQAVRMGLDVYQKHAGAKKMLDRADEILGRSLTDCMFKGPMRDLTQTVNAQPAVCAVSAACLELIKETPIVPAAVAGHSLGELTALYTAGVFDYDTLIRLADLRGRCMQGCAERHPGSMLAVSGMRPDLVADMVHDSGPAETLVVANYNAPDQVVLSGSLETLQKIQAAVLSAGARGARFLEVSGAWHSPLMAEAQQRFLAEIKKHTFSDAVRPVYCNVDARPVRDAVTLKENLVKQICSPVLWSECIKSAGWDYSNALFVEIGPGHVLKGLVLSNDRRRKVYSVGDMRSFEKCKGKCL